MPNLPAPSLTAFAGSLIREPIIHFLLIGVTVFALQGFTAGPQASGVQERQRIVVTDGRIRQLVQVFTQTWRRPPTKAELSRLVEAWLKEEVYYREAVKLGLDKDDTVVRRRMQQKMEFLTEPGEEVLTAGDADLQAYLEAHREEFRVPSKVAFEQVFIRSGTKDAEMRIEHVLKRLRAGSPNAEYARLGDRTLLPERVDLTPLNRIAGEFGPEFARALEALPRKRWVGPVRSPYGLHLVRVTSHEDAVDPPLNDVRPSVERDWRQARREAYLQAEYERLRAKYDVVFAFKPQLASIK